MLALWIVIGCLSLTGIGLRFIYHILGLTVSEAATVYVLMILLVAVNTAPAREIISQLF